MSSDIIVSYDGTPNDNDALALGRALAAGGARLALAYVRHFQEFDPSREQLAQHDAERRLQAGADVLGDPDLPRHVVFSASTNDGLERLAETEGASVIVFGSDYRTAPGHAEPGNTAQRLLEGGPVAIAVAQAGLRTKLGQLIGSIAVAAPDDAGTGRMAAEALADELDARVVDDGLPADLVVAASPSTGRPGRVGLSGAARSALNSARGSVVILPTGASTLL